MTLKVPFLERRDELELQLIQIDVKTASTVPTADYNPTDDYLHVIISGDY